MIISHFVVVYTHSTTTNSVICFYFFLIIYSFFIKKAWDSTLITINIYYKTLIQRIVLLIAILSKE